MSEHPNHQTENLPPNDETTVTPLSHEIEPTTEQSDLILSSQRIVNEGLSERTKKSRSRTFYTAVGAAGAGAVAGLVFGINKLSTTSGDVGTENPASAQHNRTSAPNIIKVASTSKTPEVTPDANTEGSTLETANTAKAKEFVEAAKEPIPSSLPVNQIIKRIGQNRNIYFLSGEAYITPTGPAESETAQETGMEIMETIYGPNPNLSDGSYETRLWVSYALHLVNNLDPVKGTPGTWQSTYELVKDNGDGSYLVREVIESNILELRGSYFRKAEAVLKPQTFMRTVKLDTSNDSVLVLSNTLQ
jgi:hypothetical protein